MKKIMIFIMTLVVCTSINNAKAQQIINNDKFIIVDKPVDAVFRRFELFDSYVPSYNHFFINKADLKEPNKTTINFVEKDTYSTTSTTELKEFNSLIATRAKDSYSIYLFISSKLKPKYAKGIKPIQMVYGQMETNANWQVVLESVAPNKTKVKFVFKSFRNVFKQELDKKFKRDSYYTNTISKIYVNNKFQEVVTKFLNQPGIIDGSNVNPSRGN